ncbi:class I SAM-dependent methyltransferase [Marinilongibacter aquaticus]|uniref:O-methyltransferase n=1 Tax=Marinilongibacter aquaticus TaxID=2975157 RepID=UPI0021BD2320|nr:class I SAM-dependent methyltransferase [Marinilongibacter aquaticus]UBM59112.1 class I SAM-dependent methyltransferase [Marinilongibacter aquaticus]
MLSDFIAYRLKAKDEHALHSPFLFDFYTAVIKNRELLFETADIENCFKDLLKDERLLQINDLGAGSKFGNKPQKAVSKIARGSLKNKKWSDILAAIVAKYKYSTNLELGTSLGLTAVKMARANPFGKVYTFEGCGETLKVAKENFRKLGAHNVTPMLCDLDTGLQNVLNQIEKLDLVFFDANHRYTPTMRYFGQCLAKAHEGSCFVFDDIHWSKEMTQAWDEIKAHPQVRVTLDFFQMGVVFFKKELSKQDFVLRA